MKTLTFVLITLTVTPAFADGGSYFSGPGRSPSYGPAAIAAGFGPGASTHSSQQQASNGSGSGQAGNNNFANGQGDKH